MSTADPVVRDWHVGTVPYRPGENLRLSPIHFELNQ
jgi:hypothetical protein